MKTVWLIALLLLLGTISADEIDQNYTYDMFLSQFQKNYGEQEKLHHEQIFNIKYAEVLRLKSQGYDVQINQKLDWNETQLNNFLNYHPQNLNLTISSRPIHSQGSLNLSPNSFDWRNYGRITDIKNQGSCGSCWSFSTTAQYQSLLAIQKNGTLYDLSQQYGVQCQINSYGCNGGYPIYALKLFNKTGIPLQSTYPYKSSSSYYSNSGICSTTNTIKIQKQIIKIQHYSYLSNQQIQQDLIDYGPLSVGIDASQLGFMYLGKSGIYSCNNSYYSYINHAVLLIGYNTTHWFIKNSWGTNWGDNGFGYISKNNNCLLNSYVDVMVVNWTHTPNPSPNPPTPDPAGSITLNISMTDSYGDGWNGNIIAIRQNGINIATFGQNFTSGYSGGTVSIQIPNKIQTSIVVAQKGGWSYQVGFTIKVPNGTIIYQRTSGYSFDSGTIFKLFCPTTGCPQPTTLTYFITLTDSYGDGWNGNILAFRQNGILQKFGSNFTSGSILGPYPFVFNRMQNVDIIVSVLGTWTYQVGYIIRTSQGYIVSQRNSGTHFYANTVLGSFCPGCVNLSPINVVGTQQTRAPNTIIEDQKQQNRQINQQQGISSKILNSVLIITTSILAICVLGLGIAVIMLIKSKNNLQKYSQSIPLPTSFKTEQQSQDQKSNIQNTKNQLGGIVIDNDC